MMRQMHWHEHEQQAKTVQNPAIAPTQEHDVNLEGLLQCGCHVMQALVQGGHKAVGARGAASRFCGLVGGDGEVHVIGGDVVANAKAVLDNGAKGEHEQRRVGAVGGAQAPRGALGVALVLEQRRCLLLIRNAFSKAKQVAIDALTALAHPNIGVVCSCSLLDQLRLESAGARGVSAPLPSISFGVHNVHRCRPCQTLLQTP